MTEEEKIKLFESLTVAWEFPQNKDLPCILITYKDENGNTYCLNGNFRQEGVINIGEEYRKLKESKTK